MNERTLRIPTRMPSLKTLGSDEFLWRAKADETSFLTKLGPQLAQIGAVPPPNADFVSLAVLAFLADRTVKRPAKGWERNIAIRLPVFDAATWTELAPRSEFVLRLLSGDDWQVTFDGRPPGRRAEVATRPGVDRVVLLSGGADSLCGAIHALEAGERVLLVSHWDWNGHSTYQKDLAQQLAARYPGMVWHRQHRIGRRARQIGSRVSFGDEPTRRVRSMLFIALGLAHASINPALPLWIPENGYAAINPPLAGERRGALSTRTTHPTVLDNLESIVIDAGGSASISNPFETRTKGEMFSMIRDALGATAAATLLSASHSCAHVRYAVGTGYRPSTQCGVCYGCLVRRSAFLAADIPDGTTYLHAAIAPGDLTNLLKVAAASEVRTVRYAGARGVSAADVLSLGLPDRVSLSDALAVAQRGLAELVTGVDTLEDLKAVV